MISSMSLVPYAAGTVRTARNTESLLSLRGQLDELQRQLASNMKSATYGGLGVDRVSSLSFRHQIGITTSFQNVIATSEVRSTLLTQRTDEVRKLAESARSTMLQTRGSGGFQDITSAKAKIQADFEQIVSVLNEQHDGMYLFSGRSRDTKPVLDPVTLINGDGTNDGLRTVIDERRQADLGTGTGRMTTGVVGSTVTWAEEAVGLPFGVKFVGGSAASTLTNATVTGPTGAPVSLSVNFTGLPTAGERLTLRVQLPDGQTKELAFTAGSALASADTPFAIGATAAATAANLNTAITDALTALGQGELRSASAVIAAQEFFAGSNSTPPARIAGPPFTSATAYDVPGARPTVIWYQGDDDTSVSARDTQRAEILEGSSVSFGARANEVPFRDTLAALGVVLAEDYPSGASSTTARFDGATSRAINLLNTTGGPQAVLSISMEISLASSRMIDAKERHKEQDVMLKGLLSGLESVKTEEVAVQLATLQTRLEASYQVTSSLSRLSLTNYL